MWTQLDTSHPPKDPCRSSTLLTTPAHSDGVGTWTSSWPDDIHGILINGCHQGVLLTWQGLICQKQCLGSFYRSENIYIDTRTQGSPIAYCTVCIHDHLSSSHHLICKWFKCCGWLVFGFGQFYHTRANILLFTTKFWDSNIEMKEKYFLPLKTLFTEKRCGYITRGLLFLTVMFYYQ